LLECDGGTAECDAVRGGYLYAPGPATRLAHLALRRQSFDAAVALCSGGARVVALARARGDGR
jgi:hypothetical protein